MASGSELHYGRIFTETFVMRQALLAVFFLGHAILSAQDWALINPAYRYNYSNDGTDTISNQIRVMQVDTLGPDSFRYVLNRITERCLNCVAGCEVSLNIPQFLQSRIIRTNTEWIFVYPDSIIIPASPTQDNPWTFSEPGNEATVTAVGVQDVFGILDSVRTITTDQSDLVVWSKSFGIILWQIHDHPSYSLVGVHGPNAGHLIPSPADFFVFQPGDIVQFETNSISDWNSNVWYRQFHIAERSDEEGTIVFTGTMFSRGVYNSGSATSSSAYPHTWTLNLVDGPWGAVLHSTPHSDVALGTTFGGSQEHMTAIHSIDANGDYTVRSMDVEVSNFYQLSSDAPEVCGETHSGGHRNGVILNTQLGLRYYGRGHYASGSSTWTTGAIIGGQTIGTVQSYPEILMSVLNHKQDRFNVLPNPATDSFVLMGTLGGEQLTIHDMEGRLVRTLRLNTANEAIDVQDLKVGMYVLRVEGMRPQRFMIVR